MSLPGARRSATTRCGTRTRCARAATASTTPSHAAGGRTAYVGELPPFEVGADDVHLTIVGTMFDTPLGTLTVDAMTAKNLLTNSLGYPIERRQRLQL